MVTGLSAAASGATGEAAAIQPSTAARIRPSIRGIIWTGTVRFPYEPTCRIGGASNPRPRRGPNSRMNDISVKPAPAITLFGVNLSLGRGAARVHILKDIALNIGHGEAVGLVGPSGSGKSTLLMVMAGLERPDTRTVPVAGPDIRGVRAGAPRAAPRSGPSPMMQPSRRAAIAWYESAGAASSRRRPQRSSHEHAIPRRSREPPAVVAQARLYGLHGGAGPGLLAQLRANQF